MLTVIHTDNYLPNYLSNYLSTYIHIYLPSYLSINQSINQSVSQSINHSFHLSTYQLTLHTDYGDQHEQHNTPEEVVYECAGTIRHGVYATLHNATDTFEAVTDLVDEVMAHRAVVIAVGSSSDGYG